MIKRYFKFVMSRKDRVLPEDTYVENHHIIPDSWGGPKEGWNMVKLTAREHFIAHKMLVREFPQDCSALKAFGYMCASKNNINHNRDYHVTSRDFEKARIGRSIASSKNQKGKPKTFTVWNKGLTKETDERVAKLADGQRGKKKTPEACAAMSRGQRKRYETSDGTFKGKHHTEESNKKNRISHLGKRHTDETREKQSKAHKGVSKSLEHRKKIRANMLGESNSMRGKHWYNNGTESKPYFDGEQPKG